MKRIILVAGLTIALSLVSFARKFVAERETHSALGNYRIQVDDKSMFINVKEHVSYVITYENSNPEVKVAIDMDKEGKKYYVISDNFSVKYVANRHYFGVEKLLPELEKDSYKTSDAALNRLEYSHQKAITTNQGWKHDNTRLIAVYFPMLLNNSENVIATK